MDNGAEPPDGWPGPGSKPTGDFDLLNRAQAVSLAFQRLALLSWTLLRAPREHYPALRTLLRALESPGSVSEDDWRKAYEVFLPPGTADWMLR